MMKVDRNRKIREKLKEKKRIVIKVGSSSITHAATGAPDLAKIEKLVRTLSDLKEEGKDIVLVSSGAIATGKHSLKIAEKDRTMAERQAFSAVGQARLMTTYQTLFSEYAEITAQILLTKDVVVNPTLRRNAVNTFEELFKLNVIPVVNENDSISTLEIHQLESFNDNDQLAAMVASIIRADLVILLTDINGMYTDDPRSNPDAEFISYVPVITREILDMGKESATGIGTGGMSSKLNAARITTDSGADMLIARLDRGDEVNDIMNGENIGTLFTAHKNEDFNLMDFIRNMEE